ncbi:penicillin-insensitive murein endopeptidase [Ignatzschineria sp. F8392]|nr:penicillin-insensitive murein endopeptidase [Ignatzschineria sp. F8392]
MKPFPASLAVETLCLSIQNRQYPQQMPLFLKISKISKISSKALSKVILVAAFLLISHSIAHAWHTIASPSNNEQTVIFGSYANGCIDGAITIPTTGLSYQQVRPSRNRHYGAPEMADFIAKIDRWALSENQILIFGDISQPRGGPANFGHASHQTGLDIDIWFEDRNEPLPESLIEKLVTPSVVNPKKGDLNQHWRPFYRDLLYYSATNPQTERIFINPVIKAALCQSEEDRSWLQKLRPWFGHDSHFHIRLQCPKDSEHCIPQAPIPVGDGCNQDLQNWVNDQINWHLNPPKKSAPIDKPPKVLPIECQVIKNK